MTGLYLANIDTGHAPPKRALIQVIERLGGLRFDDVARTSLYRPRFFGRAWLAFVCGVMRGPSDWTPGERELVAAFASWLNRCRYCVGVHTATAALGMAREVQVSMLENWREADLGPRVRAAFTLLEKRAADPSSLSARDLNEVRAAGVSDDAITDLLYIAFTFDVVNRLADAFGFTTVDDEGRRKTAAILYRIGYRVPGFLVR